MKPSRLMLPALAVLSVSGCTPPGTFRKVRGSIRDVVAKQLGPADRYDISTSRDSARRLKHGHLSEVKVHGINVHPAPGYVLDEIFVTARNVTVSRREKRVEGAESTEVVAYVSAPSLAQMVTEEGSIKQPRVRILQDRAQISGIFEGPVTMNIVAEGTVRIAGATGVEFVSEHVTAGGIPVPFPVDRTLDFGKLYKPLVLTGVRLEPGRAILTGTIDWSKVQ